MLSDINYKPSFQGRSFGNRARRCPGGSRRRLPPRLCSRCRRGCGNSSRSRRDRCPSRSCSRHGLYRRQRCRSRHWGRRSRRQTGPPAREGPVPARYRADTPRRRAQGVHPNCGPLPLCRYPFPRAAPAREPSSPSSAPPATSWSVSSPLIKATALSVPLETHALLSTESGEQRVQGTMPATSRSWKSQDDSETGFVPRRTMVYEGIPVRETFLTARARASLESSCSPRWAAGPQAIPSISNSFAADMIVSATSFTNSLVDDFQQLWQAKKARSKSFASYFMNVTPFFTLFLRIAVYHAFEDGGLSSQAFRHWENIDNELILALVMKFCILRVSIDCSIFARWKKLLCKTTNMFSRITELSNSQSGVFMKVKSVFCALVLFGLLLSPCFSQESNLLSTQDQINAPRDYSFNIFDGTSSNYTMQQFMDNYISAYRLSYRALDDFFPVDKEKGRSLQHYSNVSYWLKWLSPMFFIPLTHEEAHRSILTAQGIGSISQPWPNIHGVCYVKGVGNATLQNLRDTQLPVFIRLHTAGIESDYEIIRKEKELISFKQETLPGIGVELAMRESMNIVYMLRLFQNS